MWRWQQWFTSLVCLFSIVSLSFMFVMFSSSSKPLFPHFIGPSILTVCTCVVCMKRSQNLSIVFYRSHSLYTWRTKPWQTWMASQSYFIILKIRTCDVRNHDRLSPVWGSLRLAPIMHYVCIFIHCCYSTQHIMIAAISVLGLILMVRRVVHVLL